jgi:hypothetical protein
MLTIIIGSDLYWLLATQTGATRMASRTAHKPTILPAKQNATAVISYVRELPGAVFFGDAINDDCQEMLWHDLSQMGFESNEIRQFVTNPPAITNCGYGMPISLRQYHSTC